MNHFIRTLTTHLLLKIVFDNHPELFDVEKMFYFFKIFCKFIINEEEIFFYQLKKLRSIIALIYVKVMVHNDIDKKLFISFRLV